MAVYLPEKLNFTIGASPEAAGAGAAGVGDTGEEAAGEMGELAGPTNAGPSRRPRNFWDSTGRE